MAFRYTDWKVISTESFETRNLGGKFKSRDCRFSVKASNLFAAQGIASFDSGASVRLGRVQLKDIRLIGGVFLTYGYICDVLIREGFQLCMIADAIHLRLQYGDQPKHEIVTVATQPMENSLGLNLFDVGHNDRGKYLGTRTFHVKKYFNTRCDLVFRIGTVE